MFDLEPYYNFIVDVISFIISIAFMVIEVLAS
jgi:hypothetical protein